MHDKKLFGTATVGTKGQVVIPAEAREALGIEAGDRLYVLGSHDAKMVCLIQEEQLRTMVERLTDNVELFQGVLDNKHRNRKD